MLVWSIYQKKCRMKMWRGFLNCELVGDGMWMDMGGVM